jgi:hypothetical protein
LQRLSTILEFVGILRRQDGGNALYPPQALEGTRFLPNLSGKKWEGDNEEDPDAIGQPLQLQIKRARMRVEILKSESDPKAKFELFQRLNTGGAILSPQEVRNCVAVMLNQDFHQWMSDLRNLDAFRQTIDQTDVATEKQSDMELALRFFSFRNVAYQRGLNVHEYLDEALIEMATNVQFDRGAEGDTFTRTFQILDQAMGSSAFKRWNGAEFSGKFLMSVFEVVATGVSKNLDTIEGLGAARSEFIVEKCKALWTNETFTQNNGAGVRGTTRLTNLLPMAAAYFVPA